MAEVGSAYVSLMPSAKGFGSAMQSEIGPQVDGVGKSVGSKFGTLFKVGALAAVGGAFVVGKFLKGAVDEAREAQIVTARTENVIKRMGGAANVSAKQVADLAGSISKKTGIDDEAIQSGQNLLLTFGNIRNEAGKGNDIFNRTSQLMVDMSAAMGTDAKGSAIQLGKALNDPVKGVTALTRSGVSFTEQQKEQIKSLVESGKTLEAQKLILGEVEKQFGGAAAAMATPADKVAVAWGNVKEQIGTALLPVIDNVLNKVLQWMPEITAGIDTAIGAVRGWVTDARALFSGGGLGGGASSFATILTGTVLPAIQSAGSYLRDQLLPAVMGVVNAFKYQFQQIAPIVVAAVAGLIERIAPYWPQILGALKQVVSTFKSSLELIAVVVRTGTDILTKLWEKFGARFLDYLASTLQNVVQVVRGALNIVQGVIRLVTSLIKGDWSAAWDAVKQILKGAWQIIEGIVKQGLSTLKFMLSNLGDVLKTLVSKAWDLAKSAFQKGIDATIALAKAWPRLVIKAMGAIGSLLYNAGKDLIRGFINGIGSMAGAVADKAKEIASGAVGAVKGALGIKSPSRVFHQIGSWTMEGLVNGLASGEQAVVSAVLGVGTKVQVAFLDRLTAMRDGTRSILNNLRADFASMRDSIASTFTSNLFSAEDSGSFLSNLTSTRLNLGALSRAFKKLEGWGLSPKFLAQLFQSGNTALILDLAAGTKADARNSNTEFSAIQSLSSQLGGAVARDSIGPRIDRTNARLKRIEHALERLPERFARSLDGASAEAQRRPA